MNEGNIFVVESGGRLQRLRESPFDSEDDFQDLIARYPDLIPGGEIDPEVPRRWLFLTREAPITDRDNGGARWALDHLFVDQEAIPTFVEVKRRGDTRLRREVVGQMLDYAANAVAYWSQDVLWEAFEKSARGRSREPAELLAEFLDDPAEQETFWDRVWTNLRAGRVRLLFVADHVPAELQRVIEFLNEQMNPAEVLGIELRHFSGDGLRTLVPRVVGRTAQSVGTKQPGSRTQHFWALDSMCSYLEQHDRQDAAELVQDLSEWTERHEQVRTRYGRGANPTLSLIANADERDRTLLYFGPNDRGVLIGYLALGMLMGTNAFASEEARRDLQHRFLEVAPELDRANLDRYPSFSAECFLEAGNRDRLKELLLWMTERIASGADRAPE